MNRYKKGWITCSLKLQQIITANRNVLYVLWAYKIIVNKSDLANQVQSGFTIFTTQGFSNSREQSRLETIGYRRFGLQIWTMYMHFPLSLLYKLTCKSEICWQDISWAFYVNFAKQFSRSSNRAINVKQPRFWSKSHFLANPLYLNLSSLCFLMEDFASDVIKNF